MLVSGHERLDPGWAAWTPPRGRVRGGALNRAIEIEIEWETYIEI